MDITRPPVDMLRPLVSLVWASGAAGDDDAPRREHVLPTGAMHLVIRLSGSALWLLDDAGRRVEQLRGGIVGGARARYYARELAGPAESVGVLLRPGASEPLFGLPADALAGRHTALEELWGAGARALFGRLLDTPDAATRSALLESALLARLRQGCPPPVAAGAFIERADAFPSVSAAVAASGCSHRHFVALVRRATGLAPKTWQRVRRFQRALRLAARTGHDWVRVAHDAGYSDQAHFCREFVELAGVTPTAWRAAAPPHPNHVPLPAGGTHRPRGQIPSRRDRGAGR